MNIKTLHENPQKINDCVELIEKAFNYDGNNSYRDDFPQLFFPQNLSHCYFLEEDGEVIATLLTLPRELEYRERKLSALFIGGIGVKDEKRGGGLFRSLLETVLLLNSHKALFLLWSDLSQLYEKFSFYEFGLIKENDLPNNLPNNFQEESLPKNLRPAKREDIENSLKSYQELKKNFLLPHRGPIDWKALSQSKSIQILKTKESHLYFIGKGMDLQGICHERHPFNAPDLPGLKNWLYDSLQQKKEQRKEQRKEKQSPHQTKRYMGFLRLGNLKALSEFLESSSKGRLALHERKDNGLISISFDKNPYELSERDLIQGLWGPGKMEEWEGLAPPLLIFGYDSI